MSANQHGGHRKGAGRPPQGMMRKTVTIDEQTIAILTQLGDGELSKGIRIAAQIASQTKPA
jgi:hypothetical protein